MRNNYFRHLFAALLLLCTTTAASAQNHTVTYKVDGQVYATNSFAEGETITFPAAPSKAGYTFLGWSKSTELNQIDLASNADAMLYSNAPCQTNQYGDQFVGWHVLFDGRDDTFFHSDYSGADSEDGLDHYLRVDMGEGKGVSIFSFNYTNRSTNSHINAPKTIIVEGSNDAFGEYEPIATLTGLSSVNSEVYESPILGNGNIYRYIRFRVTATHSNQMKANHPFFFIAEFEMYEVDPAPVAMPAEDITLYARFRKYSSDIEQDGVFFNYFNKDENTVKVTKCQATFDGYEGDIVIPATVTHNDTEYTVVGAESGAFAGNTKLTAISIPATFVTIDASMFVGCTALADVTIADGITSIGNSAFSGCTALAAIDFPASITAIGNNAFESCTALVDVEIPETITSIGAQAFKNCTALESIEIPSSITELQQRTFQSCTSLTEVILPETMTELGEATFEFCSSLTNFNIPDAVTVIRYAGFRCCYSLESLEIPVGVTNIEAIAFENCWELERVIIPSSVSSFENNAFRSCTNLNTVVNLSSLTITAGSENHGKVAYYANNVINAPNATVVGDYVFYAAGEGGYAQNAMVGYFGDETELVLPESFNGEDYFLKTSLFADNTTITGVTIPGCVTTFPSAFYGCTALENVIIGEGITNISRSAFTQCSALKSVEFPSTLEVIGQSAFSNCNSLTSVKLPNTLTEIAYDAFSGCNLTSIEIPSSVTSIGSGAFENCQNLTTVINFSELALTAGSEEHGSVALYANKVVNAANGSYAGDFVFGKPNGVNTLVAYLGNDTELTLPEDYNGESYAVGENAFASNTSIESITIPAAVTSIANGAFDDCYSLTSICIEDGESTLSLGCNLYNEAGRGQGLFLDTYLESVYIGRDLEYPTGEANGWSPFNCIATLTDVVFGNTVTTIGENLFGSCQALTNVTIPSSVTIINNYAFGNNQQHIESVYISDLAAWCRIYFGTADSNPLYERANLYLNGELVTDLVIPAGITEVKNFAFNGCQSITSLTIPEGVTSVGHEAFNRCDNIATIQLPESLNTLYFGAFSRTGIETISFPAGVTELPSWILDNCHNLKQVELPSALTGIYEYAFAGCYNLASITIPGTVTIIDNYAFKGCSGLTSIEIPSSVTTIDEKAFEYCENIATVINFSELALTAGSEEHGMVAYYANNVINAPNGSIVGDFVFSVVDGVNTLVAYLGNDADVVLPESYNGENYKVGDYVFTDNTTMTSITVPTSVTAFGWAFGGCTSLEAVYISDLAAWCAIDFVTATYNSNPVSSAHNLYLNGELVTELVIPEGVTVISNDAFRGCTSFTSAIIPEGVTTIELYAFNECTSMRSISLPESLRNIYWAAFSGCSALESVTLPAGIEMVDGCAFYNCTSLAEVTCLATTPPTYDAVDRDRFTGIADNATLYVPRDCKAAYEATAWNDIPNIVELAFNLIYKVNGAVYATQRIDYGAEIFAIDGPELPEYTFIEWEGLPEYMPRHDVEVNAVLELSAIAIKISQYGAASFSSQYALDFSEVEGLKAYAATGFNTETGEITMTRQMTTGAAVGLYLTGEPNTTYYVPIIERSNNHSLNMLVGALKKTMVNTYSDDGVYVNYRFGVETGETTPKFFRYKDGSSVGAGKSYLQVPVAWFDGAASQTMGIRFDDGELTDIDEIEEAEETEAAENETIVYDLNGRRILDTNNLEKGIYIINGKKTLVK